MFQTLGTVWAISCSRESCQRMTRVDMRFQCFDVDAIGIEQSAIALNNRDDLSAIFLAEEFGGVVANITKPLNDNAFTVQCPRQACSGYVIRMSEKFLKRILNAATSGLSAASYAARI